ncbi:MAG TPA: radical SAM protein, partial [Candidatus Wunengus sp. YC63]
PSCVTCDWACFRDPSELVGPIEEMFTRPWTFINRVVTDRQFIRVWFKDILYYWACGYFNGRIPPNYKKLSISG